MAASPCHHTSFLSLPARQRSARSTALPTCIILLAIEEASVTTTFFYASAVVSVVALTWNGVAPVTRIEISAPPVGIPSGS
jgi:hypothetical protein